MAVDLTALGSITLIVLFAAFTLVVMLASHDQMGALQLLGASARAGVLTIISKDMIERIRPVIVVRHIQNAGAKTAIFGAVSAVRIMVGASCVYLGVHYPTDAVIGMSLRAEWALVLAEFFALVAQRDSS